jgi:prepilin-type N-terminal cleavage/methylation domain-containing protein
MMIKQAAGYTLFELVIVILLISILAVFAAINFGATLVTLDVDQVAASMEASVKRIHREALRGDLTSFAYSTANKSYLFDLNSALPAKHPGILVDTVQPASTKTTISNCVKPCANSICISGEPFCYASNKTIQFEPNSGRLSNNYAYFIISDRRKLAVLVSQNGSIVIAEFINNEWHSRSELQKL